MDNTRTLPAQKEHGLPAELQRSAPREVELTAAGKAVSFLAILLLAAAVVGGVLLAGKAQHDAAERDRMLAEGVPAVAQVQEIGRASGDPPRQTVRYRYTVGDASYEGRVRLPKGDAADLAPGGTLALRYLPSEPGRSWPPGQEPHGIPLPVAIVVTISGAAAAGLLFWRVRREKMLLAEGRPALARVLEVKRIRVGGGHGSHTVHRVKIEFRLLSGANCNAHFDVQRKAPAAGTMVPVVYDRENPKRLSRYPMVLVRLAQF